MNMCLIVIKKYNFVSIKLFFYIGKKYGNWRFFKILKNVSYAMKNLPAYKEFFK